MALFVLALFVGVVPVVLWKLHRDVAWLRVQRRLDYLKADETSGRVAVLEARVARIYRHLGWPEPSFHFHGYERRMAQDVSHLVNSLDDLSLERARTGAPASLSETGGGEGAQNG